MYPNKENITFACQIIQNYSIMKFYKIVLGAFLGTLIALVINFFIKVGVVSSMISSMSKETETSTTVKPNSVLYMKLDYARSEEHHV